MEIEQDRQTFKTTADRLSLVFRTKIEAYYFLSVEGIFYWYLKHALIYFLNL